MIKNLLLSLTFLCSVSLAMAQGDKTVTGKVTDGETGEAIPGVNVIAKGTSSGTVTDINGDYTLTVTSDVTSLIYSYVGYMQEEVVIGDRSTINITLTPDITALSEVVVVGYGTQQKKEITSAVVALDEKQFNQGNVNDPTQLLQGKVPGLSVYNKGGDPNSTPTIRLRGISTVGANTEPLVVIDGVIGASLDNVDPNDIESVNVLKDGSAAAIYGTRGSSGVIIVTTKRGSGSLKPTLTYNGQVAANTIQNRLDILSANEFREAGGNNLGSATDWTDEVTRTGFTQVHNIALAGGSENTNYRIATNYRDVEGILENSGFDQINARAAITHYTLNERLKIDFNASLTNRESDLSFNEALRYATFYNPTSPIFGVDANVGTPADYEQFGGYFEAALFDNFNPVAIINQNTNLSKRKILNYNIQASYNILDELAITANYGQQFRNDLFGEYYSTQSFFRGINRNGLARRSTEDRKFTLFESYLTYTESFSKIDLSASVGYSFQENQFESFFVEAGDFPNDELGFNALENSGDLNQAGLIDIQSDASPNERIIAFFGRVNLTFDNAIFFNASVRREGSTKLGADNQWGTFPAVGLGIELTNYFNLPFENLKFRAGYGVTGALPAENGLSKQGISFNRDGGTENFVLTRAANPDLKWEEKREINLGIDFAINRLSGALDVYTRNISDFILLRDVDPAVFQASQRYENAGELRTRGLELALNYDLINSQNLTYNTGIVLSTYNSKLEEFVVDQEMRANLGAPGQNSTQLIRTKVGEPIGQIWGPVFTGQVDERGIPIMADINGDGQVIASQDAALLENGDFEELGQGIPDLEFGWTNQLTFKNWDLNAFFRGAFGHSLVNTFRAFYEPRIPGQSGYNLINTELARDDISVARFSSYYVEKANFFKLDNITLGYNFNTSNINEISSIRAYFTVQNAFVITNYTGLDPEPVLQDFGPTDNGGRPADTPDVLAPGIDRRNNYFTARTFTLGLNVRF
jgi:TonB-linked SusC/RagA family outer membrane protein